MVVAVSFLPLAALRVALPRVACDRAECIQAFFSNKIVLHTHVLAEPGLTSDFLIRAERPMRLCGLTGCRLATAHLATQPLRPSPSPTHPPRLPLPPLHALARSLPHTCHPLRHPSMAVAQHRSRERASERRKRSGGRAS